MENTITDAYRQELARTIIADQESSLDAWVDHLASDDARYPDWLKYFALRSVLRMGNYEESRGTFNERTKGKKIIAPFPELNKEALTIVLSDFERRYAMVQPDRPNFSFTSRDDISEKAKLRYHEALENKNFSDAY